MASKKRKRRVADLDASENPNAMPISKRRSPRTAIDQNGNEPGHKNHKEPHQFEGKPRPKKHAVAPLKKRIRDLRRQLSRVDKMPAGVRVGHERELAGLEQELAIEEAEIQKQEMTGKYHMVRFFDRQKAARYAKKIKRQLAQSDSPDEKARIGGLSHLAEVDLNYTTFFPLACPYASLYPKGTRDVDETAEMAVQRAKGDRNMWARVEQAMKDGELEQLRNDLYTKEMQPLQIGPQFRTKKAPLKEHRSQKSKPANDNAWSEREKVRGEDDNDDGEESDGGFFEIPS